MVADCSTGFAQSNDFRVSRGIRIKNVAIESAAYDLAIVNYDRTDRDFAGLKGATGAAKGFLHPEFVGVRSVAAGGHEPHSIPAIRVRCIGHYDPLRK